MRDIFVVEGVVNNLVLNNTREGYIVNREGYNCG
jgi:hypothetical protein